jgi:hypothetical protein
MAGTFRKTTGVGTFPRSNGTTKLAFSAAVVADPSQRHDLITGRAQPPGFSFAAPRHAAARRARASRHARLARPQSPHLLIGSELRSAEDLAVAPFEVPTVWVVPHPRQFTSWSAIKVHRIHHVSDIWVLHLGTHTTNLKAALPSQDNVLCPGGRSGQMEHAQQLGIRRGS